MQGWWYKKSYNICWREMLHRILLQWLRVGNVYDVVFTEWQDLLLLLFWNVRNKLYTRGPGCNIVFFGGILRHTGKCGLGKNRRTDIFPIGNIQTLLFKNKDLHINLQTNKWTDFIVKVWGLGSQIHVLLAAFYLVHKENCSKAWAGNLCQKLYRVGIH